MSRDTPHFYSGLLDVTQANTLPSYRIQFSYGTFTVRRETRKRGGSYYVAYKRLRGHLLKAYIGIAGKVTKQDLHQATMKISFQADKLGLAYLLS